MEMGGQEGTLFPTLVMQVASLSFSLFNLLRIKLFISEINVKKLQFPLKYKQYFSLEDNENMN